MVLCVHLSLQGQEKKSLIWDSLILHSTGLKPRISFKKSKSGTNIYVVHMLLTSLPIIQAAGRRMFWGRGLINGVQQLSCYVCFIPEPRDVSFLLLFAVSGALLANLSLLRPTYADTQPQHVFTRRKGEPKSRHKISGNWRQNIKINQEKEVVDFLCLQRCTMPHCHLCVLPAAQVPNSLMQRSLWPLIVVVQRSG